MSLFCLFVSFSGSDCNLLINSPYHAPIIVRAFIYRTFNLWHYLWDWSLPFWSTAGYMFQNSITRKKCLPWIFHTKHVFKNAIVFLKNLIFCVVKWCSYWRRLLRMKLGGLGGLDIFRFHDCVDPAHWLRVASTPVPCRGRPSRSP